MFLKRMNRKRKGDTKGGTQKEHWEVKHLSLGIPWSRHSHWLEIICQDPTFQLRLWEILVVCGGLSIIMIGRMASAPPPTQPSVLCIWQPHAVNCPSCFSQFGYESEGQPQCLGWGWECSPHSITEEWMELSQQVGGPLRPLSDFQREGLALQGSMGKASWIDA